MPALPRTIRETYQEPPGSVVPENAERVCAMIFDGVPLGDHPAEPSGNRFGEREMLPMALVACQVDGEVRAIRTLEERPGFNTPDFEAELRMERQ